MPEQGIAIGALARRSGCRIETIRYYERIGLLPAPARQGRFRRYAGADAAGLPGRTLPGARPARHRFAR